MERSRALIEQADLILLVLDAASGVMEEDFQIMQLIKGKKSIVIINKTDVNESSIDKQQIQADLGPDVPMVEISALYKRGLEELEQQIVQLVLGGEISVDDQVLVTSARHKQALERAKTHLQEIISGIQAAVPGDLLSIDVKGAWEALGEITGNSVGEDLIDRIFKDFCIGK